MIDYRQLEADLRQWAGTYSDRPLVAEVFERAAVLAAEKHAAAAAESTDNGAVTLIWQHSELRRAASALLDVLPAAPWTRRMTVAVQKLQEALK